MLHGFALRPRLLAERLAARPPRPGQNAARRLGCSLLLPSWPPHAAPGHSLPQAEACLRLIHPAEDHHLRKGRSIQDRAAALRHPPVSRSISLARCCNTRFIASLTCGLLLISFLLLVLDVHSFLESITSGVVFALLGFLAGDLVDEPCINLAPQADLCLLLAS